MYNIQMYICQDRLCQNDLLVTVLTVESVVLTIKGTADEKKVQSKLHY